MKNIYVRTFSALKPYLKQLITASTSSALHAIFSGALIWMIGPLLMTLFQVDSISMTGSVPAPTEQVQTIKPGDGTAADTYDWIDGAKLAIKGQIDRIVEGETRQDTLINFCILILSIALGKNLFYYIQAFFMVFVQQSVMRSFRDRLFEKYQRLSIDYFSSRKTGEIISRITNDVVVLNDSIDIGFNRLVTDSVTLLVMAASLIILSWELTLLAIVILPVVFGFIWFIGKKMRKYSERSQRKMADVNSVVEENVNNTRIVKAFTTEEYEAKKFFKSTRDYFKALVRMRRIRHLSSPINDILATVSGAVILYYAGSKIISGTGTLDAGDFITFVIVMFSMIKPVKSLSDIHIKIQEGMAAAERIFEVMDTEETIVDRPRAKSLEKFSEGIEYRDVTFAYSGGPNVLKDISFKVGFGEIVALVGPSGAGKSTMFDLLPRFYDPQKGSILVDGHDVREVTLKSLRSLMGIVTQETYLFNDTIANNIAYGVDTVDMSRVEQAARMANAHDFISGFDNGYDTQVGNRGVMLSGGQRQRLAIARALLRDPQILIFDEATSALDTESEKLVQEAIDRLMQDRTTLVIAHRLSTVKNATRILVLEDGRIVESGTHDELLNNGGLYRRLYMMQFEDQE